MFVLLIFSSSSPLTPICKSSTKSDLVDSWLLGMFFIIPFIFRANKITESTAPCGTPFLCSYWLDSDGPIFTLKYRVWRNAAMYFGSKPRSPALYMSMTMPLFQVMSYAFSRAKKTDTKCSCLW